MSAMNMMNVNFSKPQLDLSTDYQLSQRNDHLDASRPIYVCITKISNKAILTTQRRHDLYDISTFICITV